MVVIVVFRVLVIETVSHIVPVSVELVVLVLVL